MNEEDFRIVATVLLFFIALTNMFGCMATYEVDHEVFKLRMESR